MRVWKSSALPPDWFKRRALDEQTAEQIESNVKAILSTVVRNGDAALIMFTEQFDEARIEVNGLLVTREEIKEAYNEVENEQIATIKFMKNKVSAFELFVLEQFGFKTSSEGITVQNVLRPVESVGCYVPGGQAAYPSTLVMTAVPAKAAGVPRIVVCSPPNAEGKVNPLVLVAADVCGVDEVYKV